MPSVPKVVSRMSKPEIPRQVKGKSSKRNKDIAFFRGISAGGKSSKVLCNEGIQELRFFIEQHRPLTFDTSGANPNFGDTAR